MLIYSQSYKINSANISTGRNVFEISKIETERQLYAYCVQNANSYEHVHAAAQYHVILYHNTVIL